MPPAERPAADVPGWQRVARADIDRDIDFASLPPDSGIVTPIAEPGEAIDPSQAGVLEHIRTALPAWPPARVADPVERVRNQLYVAGAADIQQLTIERHLPLVILEQLEAGIPRADLIKILYWIAVHPDEGSLSALKQVGTLRLDSQGIEGDELRYRASTYAAKLLQRVIARPARPA